MIKAKEMRERTLDIPLVIESRMYDAAEKGIDSVIVHGDWSSSIVDKLTKLGYLVSLFTGSSGDSNYITISWEEAKWRK